MTSSSPTWRTFRSTMSPSTGKSRISKSTWTSSETKMPYSSKRFSDTKTKTTSLTQISTQPSKISMQSTTKSTTHKMISQHYKMISPQSLHWLTSTRVKLHIINVPHKIKSWKIMIPARISHKQKMYSESESTKSKKEERNSSLYKEKIKDFIRLMQGWRMILNFVGNIWKILHCWTMILLLTWKGTRKKIKLWGISLTEETGSSGPKQGSIKCRNWTSQEQHIHHQLMVQGILLQGFQESVIDWVFDWSIVEDSDNDRVLVIYFSLFLKYLFVKITCINRYLFYGLSFAIDYLLVSKIN